MTFISGHISVATGGGEQERRWCVAASVLWRETESRERTCRVSQDEESPDVQYYGTFIFFDTDVKDRQTLLRDKAGFENGRAD